LPAGRKQRQFSFGSGSFMQDPQSATGNLCPLNKFGLSDYSLLQPIETAATYQRGRELERLGVTGDFTPTHLRAIHRYLFQDVFPGPASCASSTSPRATNSSDPPCT